MLFSFSPKFAAVISSMPGGTIGGVSLVLYGMISAVGVRNVVENKVDFTKSRNVLVAASSWFCPSASATPRQALSISAQSAAGCVSSHRRYHLEPIMGRDIPGKGRTVNFIVQ